MFYVRWVSFILLLLINRKFLEPHRPCTLKMASDICGGFGVDRLIQQTCQIEGTK